MMTTQRPFRFGAAIGDFTNQAELREKTRKAEDYGYNTITMGEHIGLGSDGIISLLAAVATLSQTMRLASIVFGNDFRHPTLLAQEAATIDVISDGRLEFGIGTGFYIGDYEQIGIPFDPPGVRVDRLVEAIQIIKGYFSDESVTFSGDHYTVTNLNGLPKPVQRPHPPFYIGGGKKRMLSLAGREADIVGLNIASTPSGSLDFTSIKPEATQQKVAWVREGAGKRFESIELHILFMTVVETEDRHQAAVEWLTFWEDRFGFSTGLTPDDVLESPYTLMGTEDQMLDDLQKYRELYGVSYYSIFGNEMDALGPIVTKLSGK